MSCGDSVPRKINIRILFFAKSRELSGVSEASFCLDTDNISSLELLNTISRLYNLESIKSTIVLAINQIYCDTESGEQLNLKEGDEIAIIPPLSGG
ncbi:molybdopterin synthase sulfur carrier subunit [Stomoxys calcitrans]|uniref:Molybdopterin synthase sulfur carrier subunit n=1 Tax=Stomoxys calcitrans TaxID=35570 RepID=A0A1I8NPK0_STOCA|nr:molybdopterin synthase sulfur carrier subunit [Stomoxys calcitrans]